MSGVADEWQPGQVVAGLYEVLDVVRSGGMGLVYRVRHLSWDVDLAVKVPRPDLARTSAAAFAAEAEACEVPEVGLSS